MALLISEVQKINCYESIIEIVLPLPSAALKGQNPPLFYTHQTVSSAQTLNCILAMPPCTTPVIFLQFYTEAQKLRNHVRN